jgi:hypothetical protein
MGSWYEVLVAVDQRDREEADAALLAEIQAYLEPYRRIGHDVRVIPARHVPLDITLTVCVLPTYLRGHVEAVLRDLFSNRKLTRGQAGFFHPDNLTFGQDIYLSKLVALASAVPGVENAVVTGLERHNEPSTRALEEGVLALGPFEVARLDNDPLYPEHGLLQLDVRGGR